VFNIYDFDESGELTVDEMTLALRSCISGLAKLSGSQPPLESELEKIALNAFAEADKDGDNLISRSEFIHYCSKTPEVVSWIEFYDDIEEPVSVQDSVLDFELRIEAQVQLRTAEHVAAVDPDDGAMELLEIEEKGFADPGGELHGAYRHP
jgi:Ca2+-binding EF-hand superfamily protein